MRSKLSIGYVSQEYPEETGWGGIGTYHHEIAHALARAGHRVFVLSRALKCEQSYVEEDGVWVHRILPCLNPSGIPVLWRLNRLWEGYRLAVALKLSRLVQEQNIDILEAPVLHGETLFFQKWRCDIPMVLRFHSYPCKTPSLNGDSGRISSRISQWLERQSIFLSHGLTAPSHAVVVANAALHSRAQTAVVIPNPIQVGCFTHSPRKNTSNAPLEILYAGRLDYGKGLVTLAQSLPLVWSKAPQAHFTLIGQDGIAPHGGSMFRCMLQYVPETKRRQIQHLGSMPRNRLIPYYHQATVVVQPSLWESFNYICVEAMACAKPVVGTYCGGPEEIIENGKTGFLVPPNDPIALSEKILELLGNARLRRDMGHRAQEKIRKTFDARVVGEQIVRFYYSVIKKFTNSHAPA